MYFGISVFPKVSITIGVVLGVGATLYMLTARGKPRTPIEEDE